jgi:hypothetical protein
VRGFEVPCEQEQDRGSLWRETYGSKGVFASKCPKTSQMKQERPHTSPNDSEVNQDR